MGNQIEYNPKIKNYNDNLSQTINNMRKGNISWVLTNVIKVKIVIYSIMILYYWVTNQMMLQLLNPTISLFYTFPSHY